MRTDDFNYELPQELIAQAPVEPRDSSRLMVVHRDSGEIEHRRFTDIVDYIGAGDCLVINNTKVIPARLKGEKIGTGAKVEIFLLEQVEGNCWEALVRPGRRLHPGTQVSIGDGLITATIEKHLDGGERIVSFDCEGEFTDAIDKAGEMPLPPYITRKLAENEGQRYQTVYAENKGSVAAPTAGLHFTPELITRVSEKGIRFAPVTLRVGLDTFRPVKTDRIEEHHMHSELYSVSRESAEIINGAKTAGKRIIAVGTTSVRVLETTGQSGKAVPGVGETDIFIYPGYKFKITDRIITNFHLPKSTLIMMISAFGGKELVFKAYKEAIRERYRFYSFGDAMILI
jgi:S-adenosylmethionine:tRNA ribosyltransferase-isomerase